MLNSCLNFNESKPVYAYVIKKSHSNVFKFFNGHCPINYIFEWSF